MSNWQPIIDMVQPYDVDVTEQANEVNIINRTNGKKMTVYEDECYSQDLKERYVSYIVCFATQHRHFDEMDEIAPYLLQILHDEVLPIEFYRGEKRSFGGEIAKELCDHLSVDALAQDYGYTPDFLMQYQYEVHSWSGRYDVPRTEVSSLLAK